MYALAVVGYEMLAGQPPFSGPTAQAVIAAHLTATPRPLEDLRPDAPPAVCHALARARDPDLVSVEFLHIVHYPLYVATGFRIGCDWASLLIVKGPRSKTYTRSTYLTYIVATH